jgi:hypothetical protein
MVKTAIKCIISPNCTSYILGKSPTEIRTRTHARCFKIMFCNCTFASNDMSLKLLYNRLYLAIITINECNDWRHHHNYDSVILSTLLLSFVFNLVAVTLPTILKPVASVIFGIKPSSSSFLFNNNACVAAMESA